MRYSSGWGEERSRQAGEGCGWVGACHLKEKEFAGTTPKGSFAHSTADTPRHLNVTWSWLTQHFLEIFLV